MYRPKTGGDFLPEKFAVNAKEKYSNEDFINCEFDLAERVKMVAYGRLFFAKKTIILQVMVRTARVLKYFIHFIICSCLKVDNMLQA